MGKFTEPLLDTPQSITVVPQFVMDDQGVSHAARHAAQRAGHQPGGGRGRSAGRQPDDPRIYGAQRYVSGRHSRFRQLLSRLVQLRAGGGARGAGGDPVWARVDGRRDQPGEQDAAGGEAGECGRAVWNGPDAEADRGLELAGRELAGRDGAAREWDGGGGRGCGARQGGGSQVRRCSVGDGGVEYQDTRDAELRTPYGRRHAGLRFAVAD